MFVNLGEQRSENGLAAGRPVRFARDAQGRATAVPDHASTGITPNGRCNRVTAQHLGSWPQRGPRSGRLLTDRTVSRNSEFVRWGSATGGNKTEGTVTFDAIRGALRAWNGACHTRLVGQHRSAGGAVAHKQTRRMSLIIAIEPDREQAAQLKDLVRRHTAAELILADTTEHAISAIGQRIPDLVLIPAFLSPRRRRGLDVGAQGDARRRACTDIDHPRARDAANAEERAAKRALAIARGPAAAGVTRQLRSQDFCRPDHRISRAGCAEKPGSTNGHGHPPG